MTGHLIYLWPIGTVYDISPTIYHITTLYQLHQSIISHIKLILSDSTSSVSLSSHPDYQSYNPHCMYDNTGTIFMISYEYIWNHIDSLRYQTMLWHWHTLYSCHHTQDTCHHIHCSWAIIYSVLIIAHLQYVWYQTHYMYDIIWILCDITTTLYDIKSLYSWHHIHTIPDYTATVYDMTYTLIVTSQTL